MNNFLNWWQNLNQREQFLLKILTGFLSVILIYSIIILPQQNSLDLAQQNLNKYKNTLDWVQKNGSKIGTQKKQFNINLNKI